jgi:hypothetical protein
MEPARCNGGDGVALQGTDWHRQELPAHMLCSLATGHQSTQVTFIRCVCVLQLWKKATLLEQGS